MGWIVGGCSLLAALFAFLRVVDADTFFHLAAGRLIASSGSLPGVNSLSHTFPSFPWPDPEWLFELAAFGAWRAGGFPGVQAMQMALAAAAFGFAAAAALHGRKRAGWREALLLLPLLLIVLALCRPRFLLRPQMASMVGIPLLLWLWARRPRLLPLWAWIIGAAWANFHPGVVYGALLFLLFLLSSLASRDRAAALQAGAAGGSFFAGSLLNPTFLYPYLYSLGHLAGGQGERLEVLRALGEMVPPALADQPVFFGFAALALIGGAWRWRRTRDTLPLLLFAAFLPLALSGTRFIPKFALAVFPGLAAALWDGGDLAASRLRRPVFVLLLVLLGGAGLVVAGGEGIRYSSTLVAGWGVNEAVLPVRAADAVERLGFTGPMVNEIMGGGYLAWRLGPGRGVFVDGRMFAYPPSFLREVLGLKRPLDPGVMGDILARHPGDFAIVLRNRFRPGLDQAALYEGMGWRLAFLDGISCLFVRPGSADEGRAAGDIFSVLRATAGPEELIAAGRDHPAEVRGELARIEAGRLLAPWDCIRFAAAAHAAGDSALSEEFLRRWSGLDPLAASRILGSPR